MYDISVQCVSQQNLNIFNKTEEVRIITYETQVPTNKKKN